MSSLSSSFRNTFCTSSLQSFVLAFSSSSLRSGDPSPLPSSSFMFLICCCRKYSRCCSSRSSRVFDRMFCLSSSSCISLCITRSTPMTRSLMLEVLISEILSSRLKGRLEHTKSAAITSFEMLLSANCDSSGSSSFIWMYFTVLERKSSIAVLNSVSLSSGISSIAWLTLPNNIGLLLTSSSRWHRPSPCIIAVTLLPGPGISSTLTNLAYTPYSMRSPSPGNSTCGSFWQKTANNASRSLPMSFSSLRLCLRPTMTGHITPGNITTLRVASTGSVPSYSTLSRFFMSPS